MANKPIKVIVLEGDLASLTALGFPMAVSLQLQQSCLNLSEAMWTAKSTNGGFSISLYRRGPYPWIEEWCPLASHVKRKRKTWRRRAKASKLIVISASSKSNDPELPKVNHPMKLLGGWIHTPINAHASCSPPMANNSWQLINPSWWKWKCYKSEWYWWWKWIMQCNSGLK